MRFELVESDGVPVLQPMTESCSIAGALRSYSNGVGAEGCAISAQLRVSNESERLTNGLVVRAVRRQVEAVREERDLGNEHPCKNSHNITVKISLKLLLPLKQFRTRYCH